jgi:hypothetical protein
MPHEKGCQMLVRQPLLYDTNENISVIDHPVVLNVYLALYEVFVLRSIHSIKR